MIKIVSMTIATIIVVVIFNAYAKGEDKEDCMNWIRWAMMAHEYMEAGLSREGWHIGWDDEAKKAKAEELLDALYSHKPPPQWLRECFGEAA